MSGIKYNVDLTIKLKDKSVIGMFAEQENIFKFIKTGFETSINASFMKIKENDFYGCVSQNKEILYTPGTINVQIELYNQFSQNTTYEISTNKKVQIEMIQKICKALEESIDFGLKSEKVNLKAFVKTMHFEFKYDGGTYSPISQSPIEELINEYKIENIKLQIYKKSENYRIFRINDYSITDWCKIFLYNAQTIMYDKKPMDINDFFHYFFHNINLKKFKVIKDDLILIDVRITNEELISSFEKVFFTLKNIFAFKRTINIEEIFNDLINLSFTEKKLFKMVDI